MNANDRSIAGFTMVGHALVHWFETAIPILLVVWLAEFDVSVALLGLVVAIGYAPFGLGAVPAGILTDRYGPKPLVLACLAGMSLAFLILAMGRSLAAVAIGLFCWGLAASVYHPAGLALISTGASDRGTVFAWHGIAGNVGIALGPFVTATLLVALEWPTVATLLALPGFLAVGYGLTREFDPVAAVEADLDAGPTTQSLTALVSSTKALFGSAFALVFLIVTFEGLYYRGMLTYLPEILHGLPAFEGVPLPAGLEGIEPADYVYVALLVVGIAGQYAGGKLTNRLEPGRGLVIWFIALAVLAVAFVPVSTMGLGAVIALCAVFGLCLFAIQPFYQNAVAVYTPADTRGLSYGYTYLGEFGLGATSIALGGLVLGSYSPTAFFLLASSFAVVGTILSLGLVIGLGWWSDAPELTEVE